MKLSILERFCAVRDHPQNHCGACRSSPAFRKQLEKHFEMPEGGIEKCPFGIGDTKPIPHKQVPTPETNLAEAPKDCGCARRKAEARAAAEAKNGETKPEPAVVVPKKGPFTPAAPNLKFFAGDQLVPFDNLFKGRTAFLICGGPSFGKLDKKLLDQTGILVVGINNSVKSFRPHIWVHGDSVDHFLRSTYFDPTIMKFSPSSMRNNFVFNSDKWEYTDCTLAECVPNQFFYERATGFKAETWLTTNRVVWGDEGNCRSTMFAAMRMMYQWGIRRIYLLGADFNMDGNQPYHFDEKKHDGGVRSNNGLYPTMQKRFDQLKPFFAKAGFEVFNCNPESKLKTFPFVQFEDAIKDARDEFGVPDLNAERSHGLYNDKKPDTPKAKKIEPKKPEPQWGKPLPIGHPKVYSHRGKIGDLIYALPAVRALGGGELHIVSSNKIPADVAAQLKPLLEQQPYIREVTISDKFEGVDIWTRWKEQATRNNKKYNIADQHLASLGLSTSHSVEKWLTVPDAIKTYDVLIHRSPRYHNDRFPWAKVLEKYAGRIGMVGSKKEHEQFVKKFGEVPYVSTPDFMTLARTIAGAQLFIANQSGPFAIAEGMKMPVVQETFTNWPNCRWDRPGAIHCMDGKVLLPDLPAAPTAPPTSSDKRLAVVGRLYPSPAVSGDQRAFLSALPDGDGDGYTGVIRDWQHNRLSSVWALKFDKDGKQTSERKLTTTAGEDPRIFRHCGKLMCSYVEYSGKKEWTTYLHDIEADTRIKLSYDGYHGKNWMPVMGAPDGELWVVRSLEPLVVLRVDATGATTPIVKRDGDVGPRRGGSAAVYRDGRIYGWGHRTVNYSDHHVFSFEIDCSHWTVRFDEPIMPPEFAKGVNDPTALFDDGRLIVCHSARNWFSPQTYDHLICERVDNKTLL